MQKKQNKLFLLLLSLTLSWQTLQATTLLLSSHKADLLPLLREEINLLSCFLSVLFGFDQPFR